MSLKKGKRMKKRKKEQPSNLAYPPPIPYLRTYRPKGIDRLTTKRITNGSKSATATTATDPAES